MNIEHLPLDQLTPYANNARTHSPEQIYQIANSITEFDFTNPVLIDENNLILAGHGRLMAAQALNRETIPCVRLTHLTETQKRVYILADNRIALNAGWDEELLHLEFGELQKLGANLELTGFDHGEIFRTEEEEFIEEYTKKVTSPIYELTTNKPSIDELCDLTKSEQLIKKIQNTNIPDDEKTFLKWAAYRHNVFNYRNIAEYYAHSSKQVQELMEDSALVIIDFGKAIEHGFVVLSDEIKEQYLDEHG